MSLMTKIGKKLPAVAFSSSTAIMSRVLDVLKRQARTFEASDVKTDFVKDTLLFLYNFANNTEAVKLERRKSTGSRFRPVLKDKVSFDQLIDSPEEELNIGVVVKIVGDFAHWIVSTNNSPDQGDGRMRQAVVCIIETGLTLIYSHVELFLVINKSENSKKFKEEFIPAMENKLVKNLTDVSKVCK
jgi:hypothetical protein